MDLGVNVAHAAHCPANKGGVKHKRNQVGDGHFALLHQARAVPNHAHDAPKKRENSKRHKPAPKRGRFESIKNHLVNGVTVAIYFERLVRKRLYDIDRLQRFFHNYVGFGQGILHFFGQNPNVTPENHGRNNQQGKRGEHKNGQFPRRVPNQGRADGQRGDLPKKFGQRKRQNVLHLRYVRRNTARKFAHAALFKKMHGQSDDFAVNFAAHVGHGQLADARKKVDSKKRKSALQE